METQPPEVNLDTTDEKLYDPADYTVPEVLDHLDGQHPDEVARILSLEETGKARTTLLESPIAAVAEQTEPASVEEQLGDRNPYALVRARTAGENQVEYTTTLVAALSAGSTVLDKPAVDDFGQVVPTKNVLDLSLEANPTDVEADQPGENQEN